MLSTIFAVILFLLCAFDAWLTQRRIGRYGVSVELNRGIRWLSEKIGPELGSIIGVMAPATALISIGVLAHLQWVLSMMIGFRARMFFNQVESVVFEKQIEEFRRTLGDAASPAHEHPSLVTPSNDVENKKPGTLS